MIALFFSAVLVAQAAPPSAEQLYGEALHNSRLLTQAPNASYTVDIHVTNAKYVSVRTSDGHASVGFQIGGSAGKADDTVSAVYRNDDDSTALLTQDGRWGTITSPWVNPTWSGLSDWMRYGIDGRPALSPSSSPSAVTATPTAVPTSVPHTIAAVTAMGVAYYNVSDAGAGTCANGDPGHAVHLIARENPREHPLTGATVDLVTKRLCSISIGFRQTGAFSANGIIDAALSERDGMMLVTHEHMEFNVHALAIQLKHIEVEMSYHGFAFPQTLDQALFK